MELHLFLHQCLNLASLLRDYQKGHVEVGKEYSQRPPGVRHIWGLLIHHLHPVHPKNMGAFQRYWYVYVYLFIHFVKYFATVGIRFSVSP